MKRKIVALSFVLCTSLFADEITNSQAVVQSTNNKLVNYQEKIDNLSDKTSQLANEYKYEYANLQTTKKYNEQLKKIIQSQKDEIEDINSQLVDIANTQKNIMPLMQDMISSLNSLIKLDTPFLLEERKARVKRLEETLDRADISIAEKYRIILEAFKIEYDYSKTIESYQAKIDDKTVNFLRIGRVGLYYQTLDLKEYGYFNPASKSWEIIDDSTAKADIKKGIKIAQNTQNVDFLTLPFLNKGAM